MKSIIGLFSLGLVMFACGTSSSQETLSVKAFQEQIAKTPNGVILDVRTPEEVAKGHLKGAVNVDFKASDFDKKLESLDPSKTYFVYCAAGVRSAKAATAMKAKGFKYVKTLDGGIQAWEEAGKEVVKE